MHGLGTHSLQAVTVLAVVAARHGVPAEISLSGTGLAPESLEQALGQVSQDQEIAAIANVVHSIDASVTLGAEVGSQSRIEMSGVWGFALVSSSTVGSALATVVQLLDLTFALCRLALRDVRGEMRLLLDASHLPESVRVFVLERDVMAVSGVHRQLTGEQLPMLDGQVADLTAPAGLEDLSNLVRAEAMNAPLISFAFDRVLLDRPLGWESEIESAAITHVEEVLAAHRVRVDFSAAVQRALVSGPERWGDIRAVAARLHMTPRTLQRRLNEEGTSFRTLVAEVREVLAVELLGLGMPVAEVAQRLGYVEVASFSQAFFRWKGEWPSTFRGMGQTTPWGDPSSRTVDS